jgi:hypothetical protein
MDGWMHGWNLIHPNILKDVCSWRTTTTTAPPTGQARLLLLLLLVDKKKGKWKKLNLFVCGCGFC